MYNMSKYCRSRAMYCKISLVSNLFTLKEIVYISFKHFNINSQFPIFTLLKNVNVPSLHSLELFAEWRVFYSSTRIIPSTVCYICAARRIKAFTKSHAL